MLTFNVSHEQCTNFSFRALFTDLFSYNRKIGGAQSSRTVTYISIL